MRFSVIECGFQRTGWTVEEVGAENKSNKAQDRIRMSQMIEKTKMYALFSVRG